MEAAFAIAAPSAGAAVAELVETAHAASAVVPTSENIHLRIALSIRPGAPVSPHL
jgi:hypothetical protein